ncbi:MAG: hypothetical protein LBB12_01035 [Holosporaceae bacterium]|jgi:transposase InsO family protein|nr:hypothetical protein [Holosporaceae bacterium]
MVVGERVQIDHMTIERNGSELKEFHAWERKSKHLSASIFEAATAENAKKFLLNFYANAPFKILSLQVDRGSEFRADFEEACRELKIPLIVLPPAKPKYNGGVERSNRTLREEFWAKDLTTKIQGVERSSRTLREEFWTKNLTATTAENANSKLQKYVE